MLAALSASCGNDVAPGDPLPVSSVTGAGGAAGRSSSSATTTGSSSAASTGSGGAGSTSGPSATGGANTSGGAAGTVSAGGAAGLDGSASGDAGGGGAGMRDAGGSDTRKDATGVDGDAGTMVLNGVGFLTRAGVSGVIFPDTACAPNNQSPAFTWSGVPPTAKSLAISLYDTGAYPEATSQDMQWALTDIPPTATGLPADLPHVSPLVTPSELAGCEQEDRNHTPGYLGPGANQRVYVFTLWALPVDHVRVANTDLQGILGLLQTTSLAHANYKATGRLGGFGP